MTMYLMSQVVWYHVTRVLMSHVASQSLWQGTWCHMLCYVTIIKGFDVKYFVLPYDKGPCCNMEQRTRTDVTLCVQFKLWLKLYVCFFLPFLQLPWLPVSFSEEQCQPNWIYCNRKNKLPLKSKFFSCICGTKFFFFFFWVVPIEKGGKTEIDKLAYYESALIHLNRFPRI